MKYLSICSGIEAATVAWHHLGWKPWAFAEVEAFPSAVLAHHYPDVPNLGDITKWETWPDASIDLLVGGTPCQSFSVAGKRGGMDDARGQLALAFSAIAGRYKPRYVVWENVFGVLSSGGGRDFGAFVQSLVELGYGCAWRVLDAQYVRTQRHPGAVPQRRRRVFLVGCLGSWQRGAAVLFVEQSLRRDTAKGGKARQNDSRGATCGAGEHIGQPYAVANCLTRRMHKGINTTLDEGQTPVVQGGRVRRITPLEAERAQGFPDDYTLVPFRNKPAADGPRYKSLGNSMAVNCMQWIGERIAAVEALPPAADEFTPSDIITDGATV